MTGFRNTDYTDLDTLKAHLRIADTADDAALSLAITAASRAIDQACGRQFGITGSAVQRNYTAVPRFLIEHRPAVEIDDLSDLSTGPASFVFYLSFDGTQTLTMVNGSDFDLYPWNAPADGEPYTHLVIRPLGRLYLPYWTRGVQITANWGWPSVPDVVSSACLIQASRFFVRRDSAYGVAGSPDLGNELRLLKQLDPDVALMLSSVTRYWGGR